MTAPRRRWLFGLWTMFLALAILAVLAATVAYALRDVYFHDFYLGFG